MSFKTVDSISELDYYICMDKKSVKKIINSFVQTTPLNKINEEIALTPDMVGLEMYESPLIGYADADNEYLKSLKNIPEANIDLSPPDYWLPNAKSVISFFLPFKERIRKSNIGGSVPSPEWFHARIDGQVFINEALNFMVDHFVQNGYGAVAPSLDQRFSAMRGKEVEQDEFSSNWSERHVAYAAGLGTFSLSKGLITEKGVAGRFGSIVTTAEFIPTIPKYNDIYENCTMCGLCIDNCPMNAISMESGKLHKPCSDYLDYLLEKNSPYYGCGKCQVGVPCEDCNPNT